MLVCTYLYITLDHRDVLFPLLPRLNHTFACLFHLQVACEAAHGSQITTENRGAQATMFLTLATLKLMDIISRLINR